MNFAKVSEMKPKRTFFISLEELKTMRYSKVGDIITFSSKINEDNGNLFRSLSNGKFFLEVKALDMNGNSVRIPLKSLRRSYFNSYQKISINPLDLLNNEEDKNNCLYKLCFGKSDDELIEFIQGKTFRLAAKKIQDVYTNSVAFSMAIHAFVLV